VPSLRSSSAWDWHHSPLRATFGTFITVISMIRRWQCCPFYSSSWVWMNLQNYAIIIGITPVMVRDLALRCQELLTEQLIGADPGRQQLAVGAARGVAAIAPRLLDALRLSLCLPGCS
jgi:NitT/TauT family transport system permease protein